MSIGRSQSHDLSLGEIFISLINVYFSHKSKVYQLSWINFLSAFRPSWVNLTSVKIIIIVLGWDYLGRVELFVILICNIMLWHYCKMDWVTSQMVTEIYPKNWMMLSNGVHNAIQYIQCCTQSIPSVIRSLGSFIKIYLWFFQGCETLKMLLMEVTM